MGSLAAKEGLALIITSNFGNLWDTTNVSSFRSGLPFYGNPIIPAGIFLTIRLEIYEENDSDGYIEYRPV